MNEYIFIIQTCVRVILYMYKHITLFILLYRLHSRRYIQHIKAYNSLLKKTIHLFKVKDHLYCNKEIQ